MDCAIAGVKSCPKNWVIKYRTSTSAEWETGEDGTISIAKEKVYTEDARFKGSYTIKEDIEGATLQVFVCAASSTTISSKLASGSATRMIPLMKGSEKEYPGPRITIE